MCRSGCETQDHESYGACLKAARLQVGSADHSIHVHNQRELEAYASAHAQGVQPKGTRMHHVRQALDFADKTGVGNPWQR